MSAFHNLKIYKALCKNISVCLTLILHGDLVQTAVFRLELWLFFLLGQGKRITVAAGEIGSFGWLKVLVEGSCGDGAQEQQTHGQNIP